MVEAVNHLALGILITIVGGTHSLRGAGETVFSNENCAVTFPAGWLMRPLHQSNYLAMAKSPDGLTSVILYIRNTDPDKTPQVDEEFIRNAKHSFALSGTLISDKSMKIAGHPGLEMVGKVFLDGNSVSTVIRIVIAGDRAYKLNGIFMGGDVMSDRDLVETLNSFRSLQSVQPPPKATLHGQLLTVMAFVLVAAVGLSVIRRQRRIYQADKGEAG